MLRYDTAHDVWRDVAGTADLARALLAAGALCRSGQSRYVDTRGLDEVEALLTRPSV